MKKVEMIGQRVGSLVVKKESGRNRQGLVSWLCECDCGKDVVVIGSRLRAKRPTKSCGCLKSISGKLNKKNLIGKRFGRLVVEHDIGRKPGQNVLWSCKCDCGGTAVTTTAKLNGGHTLSCGCIKKERCKKMGSDRRVWKSPKELNNSPLKDSSIFFKKIPVCDKPKSINGFVYVVCKMCGKHFQPTYQQVNTRTSSFEGKNHGENNFYCSDSCKNACPVFNYKTNHIDPRLRKPKTETVKSRDCQTKTLKQLQCDHNNGQSYCEKCGDFIDVELHHTLPVAQFAQEAVNPAGHMLLCAGCHVELHRVCA